jgi:hypothetical protein
MKERGVSAKRIAAKTGATAKEIERAVRRADADRRGNG